MPKVPLETYDTACHARLSIANTESAAFAKQPPFQVYVHRHGIAALLSLAMNIMFGRIHPPSFIVFSIVSLINSKYKHKTYYLFIFSYVRTCRHNKEHFITRRTQLVVNRKDSVPNPPKKQTSCIINILPEVPYAGKMNTYRCKTINIS